MTFVEIKELSRNTRAVLAGMAEDDKVIITDNGKPTAFMMPISGGNFEQMLECMQRISALNLVGSIQEKAKKDFPDGISDEEIQAEIDAERRDE
ncbi:MAG: hypothetical protein LUD47_05820 [Clostridia bacterium]|nr:hypothetical protein [Clostridia bacterium]